MTGKKVFGIALLIGGIALLGIALLADFIGVGDVDPDHFTFGYKQIAAAIVGTVVAVLSIALLLRK